MGIIWGSKDPKWCPQIKIPSPIIDCKSFWAWRSLPSSSDSLHAPPVPLLSSQADMRLATRHLSPRRTSPAHLSSQLALDAFHEQTSPGTAQTSLPNSHSDGTRHHHKATTLHTLLLKILLACILFVFSQHFWQWRPKPSATRDYRPTMTFTTTSICPLSPLELPRHSKCLKYTANIVSPNCTCISRWLNPPRRHVCRQWVIRSSPCVHPRSHFTSSMIPNSIADALWWWWWFQSSFQCWFQWWWWCRERYFCQLSCLEHFF